MPGEYYDQINELILKNGHITKEELNDIVVQDEDLNSEKYELLVEELAEMGIEIVEAVKAAGGPALDRRRLELPGHIKTTGAYNVQVKLHPEVVATFPVNVVPSK